MSFRKFVIASALSSCILASAAGSVQADGRVQIASSPRDLADFELTDQDGKAFRFSQLRGDAALVFFGFTHCPDICPATMVSLKQLDRSLRGSGIIVRPS